jgi:adenosylcobinamide-phosphate synthase
MAYKAVNTLDSMVGYKNERYRDFGRAAARLDDVANYLPARISGLLIVCAALLQGAAGRAHRALTVMLRDGRNHSSPNSGVPEAAMAGALGVRLGGPNFYGGMLVEKPFIGEAQQDIDAAAADKAAGIVLRASILAALAALSALIIRGGA